MATCNLKRRFADHSEEDILAKRSNVVPQNTQKANQKVRKILRDYLLEKGQDATFELFSADRLGEVLCHFYLDARKGDGERYKVSSMESFRHGLNRFLKSPPHDKHFDIIKDSAFYEANQCFKTAVAELKSLGLGSTTHYPAINDSDLTKMYSSMYMSPNTPTGLANKCQFDIRLYFCRRGVENMQTMSKDTFVVKLDEATGSRYVVKKNDELSKNHRESDKDFFSGFMPQSPESEHCPVSSFVKYMSKLNPHCNRLWQYPRASFLDDEMSWFENRPIGLNPLSKFMSALSVKCQLSQIYTNHSIRATGITILGKANFSPAQIMSVSGHKSVQSLSVYHNVSNDEKLEMGRAVSKGLGLPSACTSSLESSTAKTVRPTFQPTNPSPCLPAVPNDSDLSLMPPNQAWLDQLFCDFDNIPCTPNVTTFNNQTRQPNTTNQIRNPIFQNCSIGNINIILKQ